jgi:NAD-dependent deacetylase
MMGVDNVGWWTMGSKYDPKYRPKIVALTGAGLSADSGIRTYRGEGGLYQGIDAEKVMSDRMLKERPEIIQTFCDDRRVELDDVAPNAAHAMLSELGRAYGERFMHFTQNIDDLAERAGGEGVQHVHGRLTLMRSIGNSKVERDIGYARYWSGPEASAPEGGYQFRCPKSGSRFRPGVVLFGEQAPLYPKLWRVMGGLHPDDLLIVIGTFGEVLPVRRWSIQSSCRKVLNNLAPSPNIDESLFTDVFMQKGSDAAGRIMEIAKAHMGAP